MTPKKVLDHKWYKSPAFHPNNELISAIKIKYFVEILTTEC